MHGPPATSHTVVRSNGHGRLLLGIALAMLLASSYFTLTQDLALPTLLLWLGVLTAAAWAWRAWVRSPMGLLQWDGERWFWTEGGTTDACAVHIQCDLQALVLIRLTREGRPARWLFLESADAAGNRRLQWRALRRALVAAPKGFTGPTPSAGLEPLP